MKLTKKELVERINNLRVELFILARKHAEESMNQEDREAAFSMGVSIGYSAASSDVSMLLYEDDSD